MADGGVILLCMFLLVFISVLALVVAAAASRLWKLDFFHDFGCPRRRRYDSFDTSRDMWDAGELSAPRRMQSMPEMHALEWHPEWNNDSNKQQLVSTGNGNNHGVMPNTMLCLPSSGPSTMGAMAREGTHVMVQHPMQNTGAAGGSMASLYGAQTMTIWDDSWGDGNLPQMDRSRGMNAPGIDAHSPKVAKVEEKSIVELEEVDPSERYVAAASLQEAMWGFGALLDRFIQKTPTKNETPLDYEGLYFILRGLTAEQILLMVLCLETLVFKDAPKYTNRVWTLVLRYYVENTKWENDERIPPIPTEQARKQTKEADKLVLAWHQFERTCVSRLAKYNDVKERIKALRQVDSVLPRRPEVMEVDQENSQRNSNGSTNSTKAPLDSQGCSPDPKRAKRGLSPQNRAPSTPLRNAPPGKATSGGLEKTMRSPSAVVEEPDAKRLLVAKGELMPAEYTYRSIDGELRVFSIKNKGDELIFTQMSKSCELQKSTGWYVGDLGQGFRVRLQPIDGGKGVCLVDLQFCPGPRKRWQNKVTATSTRK
eukprot:GEMP01009270.1.p1 GENE.GEMP01009270.1~~GEMP01009270.1.p1  ORF type:complete len:539 (+),score=128.79 GEMP01009270.1:231-1847(+)